MTDLTFSSRLTFPATATSTTSSTETEPDWHVLFLQHMQTTPAVLQKLRGRFSLRSSIEFDQSTVLPSQTPRNATVDISPHHDSLIQGLIDDDHLWANLERHAHANDYGAFQTEVARVPWERHTPAVLVRTIKLALSHEWLTLADKLVRQGYAIFPHDPTIMRIAHVLAPPTISVVPGEVPHGLAASRAWHGFAADPGSPIRATAQAGTSGIQQSVLSCNPHIAEEWREYTVVRPGVTQLQASSQSPTSISIS